MKLSTNSDVDAVFNRYPPSVQKQMQKLRKLILNVAENELELRQLEETLKWGEPSYLTKHGSTIRIDWKEKNPDQFAIYFKCTSKLVPTFRELYPETFQFEDNRAIVFRLDDSIPEKELTECIKMALRYHKLKHLPFLGGLG
jgi:hypothetical protein